MSCRFFYQLEHILDSYYSEIKKCIDNKPDVIFLLKDKSLLNIFYGKHYVPITTLLQSILNNGYNSCGNNQFYHIFSNDKKYCKSLKK